MRHPPIPEIGYLRALLGCLTERLRRAHEDGDKGAMSAEAMIIIGILVATAITALGIIASKIIAKANSIHLG